MCDHAVGQRRISIGIDEIDRKPVDIRRQLDLIPQRGDGPGFSRLGVEFLAGHVSIGHNQTAPGGDREPRHHQIDRDDHAEERHHSRQHVLAGKFLGLEYRTDHLHHFVSGTWKLAV